MKEILKPAVSLTSESMTQNENQLEQLEVLIRQLINQALDELEQEMEGK